MIDKSLETGWIAWFVRNPVAANLLMIGILAGGLVTAIDIRTEEFPASDPNSVVVRVDYNGGTPETVEEAATIKVENALEGLDGVYRVTSTVNGEQSITTVQGEDGYPVQQLKDNVSRRIDAITGFPDQVERVTVTEELEERSVLMVQLYGATDHETLKQVAVRVRDQLLTLPSVNKVNTEGARQYEITIEVRDDVLSSHGLGIDDVAAAVRNESIDLSGGELQTRHGRITLQSRQQVHHGRDLHDVVVRSLPDGATLTLGDVATIRDGYGDQEVLSTFQGEPSIGLEVMLIGRDSITRAASETLEALRVIQAENWFPQTIQITTWANEADSIRDSLSLLSINAMVGMALVLVLLALFLDPRIAFWVAVGIPVSFAGTFMVLGPGFLDQSVNNLTVFGLILVLGIVVDDAIVIAESVYTHQQNEGDPIRNTIRGAQEVAVPATFGVLTTVAAFFPLAMITGNFGGPFRIIAIVAIVCLLFSLLESKLILPGHLAGARTTTRKGRVRATVERALSAFVARFYLPFLRVVVQNRYQSLCVFLSVLVLCFGIVGGGVVKVVFFGEDNDRLVFATVKMDSGTPARQTHTLAREIEAGAYRAGEELQRLHSLPENPVQFSRVFSDFDLEATVIVQIPAGTEREYLSQDFLDLWREAVGSLPEARQVLYFIEFEDDEDMRIEVTSKDPASLSAATHRLIEELQAFPAIVDLSDTSSLEAFELDIFLRPEANLLGLRNNDIIQQVRSAIYGMEAQRFQRGMEEVRIMVRYPMADRNDITDLRSMMLPTQNGTVVPFSTVADLQWSRQAIELNRIDGKRVSVLTGMIDEEGVASSSVLEVIEDRVFPEIQGSYPGVMIELAGDSREESNAMRKLSLGFLTGLLAVYALLAIPLKSYVAPLIILIAVPFGIVGAILGHLLMGIPLGFLSLFGMIALTGVVVNDSLILVCRFNQEREREQSFLDAILEAGRSRFRAVFLTSITAFAGLMPLILDKSEQAQELIPMAVSLAFGILFSTVITLLIIPVLLGIRQDAAALFDVKLKVA